MNRPVEIEKHILIHSHVAWQFGNGHLKGVKSPAEITYTLSDNVFDHELPGWNLKYKKGVTGRLSVTP